MISFYKGQITDVLPNNFTSNVDVQALSYAVKNAMQKLQNYADKTLIYTSINNLSEKLLNHLAVEIRAPYYSEDMNLETKQDIIQNTIAWYCKAGTSSAVKDLVVAIFGTGEVSEWFNYSGEAGHFKITTENYNITTDNLEKFETIIERLKRKSAVLDAIEITLSAHMDTYYGAVVHTRDYLTLTQEG
jgi:phage tail P2-like protein